MNFLKTESKQEPRGDPKVKEGKFSIGAEGQGRKKKRKKWTKNLLKVY